jgi:prepilin peptidase CpaA
MQTATALALSIFPALMIASALLDLTTMTIPNRISAALVLAFYPTAFMVGLSPMTVLISTGVGAGLLILGAGMFALNWVGGGDAKIFAAAGLWMGLAGLGPFVMWTAVSGGVFGASLLLLRGLMAPYAAQAPGWMGRLMTPKGDIPYGVAICAGALAGFPESALIRDFSGIF